MNQINVIEENKAHQREKRELAQQRRALKQKKCLSPSKSNKYSHCYREIVKRVISSIEKCFKYLENVHRNHDAKIVSRYAYIKKIVQELTQDEQNRFKKYLQKHDSKVIKGKISLDFYLRSDILMGSKLAEIIVEFLKDSNLDFETHLSLQNKNRAFLLLSELNIRSSFCQAFMNIAKNLQEILPNGQ